MLKMSVTHYTHEEGTILVLLSESEGKKLIFFSGVIIHYK